MRNYDFHELLSPSEFQSFAASVLRVKEKRELKTNAMTRDGGIDLYFLDDDTIAQVKNYKNNENKVVDSLKSEVARIKELNPKRYIVVTSALISKQKREKLVSMFDGILTMQDIIDKDDLNELLTRPEYHRLEIGYLKLLVPNSFVLENYLKRTVNNYVYTRTEIELNKIRNDRKVFSVNEIFEESLDKLLEDKAIIIFGEAGIGKSILGRMLAAYLINEKENIGFLSVSNLSELFQMYEEDKTQVFFFDDFWGDTKYNFLLTDREKEELFQFIKLIEKDGNKWLIITSREYILKDGAQSNKKLRNKYPLYKFSIDLKNSSLTDKFNILFKHLNCINLEWEHLRIILRNWQTVVDKDYYNPRYIATFLDNYKLYKDLNSQDFFETFIKYLRFPYEFWKDVLVKQPKELRMLLIIIALNKNDISSQELDKKYNEIVSNISDPSFEQLEFRDVIKRLEDDFLTTQQVDDNLTINFKNPSYKDFIHDYLKNNMASYISYLSRDDASLVELVGLWEVLNKDFKLFKDLKEVKKVDVSICMALDVLTIYDKYYYLLNLARSTEFNNGSCIEKYLIDFVVDGMLNIEDIMWSDDNYFNLIIYTIVNLEGKYDFSTYIYDFLCDMVFENGNLSYLEKVANIKRVYPEIYKVFYKKQGKIFRDALEEAVLFDADFYLEENDVEGLAFFMDIDVPELYDELGIKIPETLMNKLNTMYESLNENSSDGNEIEKEILTKPKREKKEDLSLILNEIKELIGENDYIYFDTELKNMNVKAGVRKEILKINNNLMLEDLLSYRPLLVLIVNYFNENNHFENDITFFNAFEDYITEISSLSESEFFAVCGLASWSTINKKIIFKLDDILNIKEDLFNSLNIGKILASSFFVKRGEWYHFIHPLIQAHLILRYFKTFNLSRVKMMTFLGSFVGPKIKWSSIDFYGFDDTHVLRLIKKMYPEKWREEISIPEYQEFVKIIDKSNKLEIAKSMLKYFKLKYEYHDDSSTRYRFDNAFLASIINIDFDFDIVELFISGFTPSNKIDEYIDKLMEENKKLVVNEKLKTKSFMRLFEESGLIEILNDIYDKILKEIKF